MAFFVLSGLIIAEALESFYRQRAWAFLTNRFLRIVPTYAVALALSIGIHAYLSSTQTLTFLPGDYKEYPVGMFSFQNIGANLLMIFSWEQLPIIGAFFKQTYYFVRYVWAVSVEVHFYIVVVFLYSFWWGLQQLNGKYGSANVGKYIGRLTFIIGVLTCLFLALRWKEGVGILWSFSFSAYFVLGVSLYYSLKTRSKWAIVAAIASYLLSSFHLWNYLGNTHHTIVAVVMFSVIILSVVILFSATIPTAYEKVDKSLGDLSYPFYLNHYVWTVFAWNTMPKGSMSLFWGVILGAILFSWAASKLSEPLVSSLRDKVRGTRLRI